MEKKIRATVWGEFRHEKHSESVKKLYPNGLHAVVGEALAECPDIEVTLAALDDPDIAGCEGSGTLVVPASGTLRLSFASSRALPSGKWPLLTATSGGDALTEAAWPVVYADGPRPLNFEIVRDSTGVWLQAFNGTTVLVR